MTSALRSEGTVVGIVADSLLRTATSKRYREYLLSGHLALISLFNPNVGFNVGNAMSRNKYIYCLADAAVVVSSANGKGGTWNGTIEDLKAGWIPLQVNRQRERGIGSHLVRKGA